VHMTVQAISADRKLGGARIQARAGASQCLNARPVRMCANRANRTSTAVETSRAQLASPSR
jgi:hypothetical protein